jgi:hypothetical protein
MSVKKVIARRASSCSPCLIPVQANYTYLPCSLYIRRYYVWCHFNVLWLLPMAYSSADGRRVFLAYRTVFTGPHAHIRKSKKVREVIEQHRGSFQPFLRDFGFDKVADIVKTLLDQRVFESELKAKIAFPELFQTSPARDVQCNESENDAARSAAEALEELTSASERGGLSDDHKDDSIPEGKLPNMLHITTQRGS